MREEGGMRRHVRFSAKTSHDRERAGSYLRMLQVTHAEYAILQKSDEHNFSNLNESTRPGIKLSSLTVGDLYRQHLGFLTVRMTQSASAWLAWVPD
jgi:hypothetical protein